MEDYSKGYGRSYASIGAFVFYCLSHPRLVMPGLKVAFEALRGFFIPQFRTAWFKGRPVVYVDHPLDKLVPYLPQKAPVYMSFVSLWMNAAMRLDRRYGERGRAAEFIRGIAAQYHDAAFVYKRIHSATIRPKRIDDLYAALIRVFDPHLNCIPSLHVSLALGSWAMAAAVVAELKAEGRVDAGGDAEAAEWLAGLYGHALAIVDCTMLMKQHSVNCVGASLWYLGCKYPEILSDEKLREIADGLFSREAPGLEASPAIRRRASEVLTMLGPFRSPTPGGSWLRPILRFLASYRPLAA